MGIFEPGEDPLARSFVGDVGEGRGIVGGGDDAAVGLLDGVAMNTAVGAQHFAAEIQLGRALEVALVTLAAGGFEILGGENGLFPCERAFVGIFDRGRGALAAMAEDAAKFFELVRDGRMRAIGLKGDVGESGFLHGAMAGGATIDDAEFGEPDLLNAGFKMSAESNSVTAPGDEALVAALIAQPVGEEILGGRDGEEDQQN